MLQKIKNLYKSLFGAEELKALRKENEELLEEVLELRDKVWDLKEDNASLEDRLIFIEGEERSRSKENDRLIELAYDLQEEIAILNDRH